MLKLISSYFIAGLQSEVHHSPCECGQNRLKPGHRTPDAIRRCLAHRLQTALLVCILLIAAAASAQVASSDADQPAELRNLDDATESPAAGINSETPAVAPEREIRVEPKRLRDYGIPGMDAKINLVSIQPMDVVTVIQILSDQGKLNNVVITKDVAGLTTRLKFSDVTVADALEVVLSVNNLAYEMKGGILKIMTDNEYKIQYGTSFYDYKKVKIIDLKYADPTRVMSLAEKVKSSIGTVVADPVTGTMILIDTPDKIREMEAIISKADIATVSRVVPTETKTFVLQYADVENVKGQVETLISKDIGSIRADKRTKTLIVTELPHTMSRITDLVKLFDKRPRQVFIEAKIVEVSLTDDFSMGVNWQHVFQGLDPRFALQSVSQPSTITTPIGALSYNTIVAGGDLTVIVEALKKIGSTEILSNPNIAVLDGEEAKIEVVEDQPYKEIKLESGTTNVTGVTYQFKKVGVQLAVTPKINDEHFISIGVKPEISSISQWYDGGSQEGTPVIKKATAETTVLVKDGITIIIGGMIQDRKDESKSSVPFLGSIPLIGRLFRYDSVSLKNVETVVFLTPRIVGGDESYPLLRDTKKQPKPLRSVGNGNGNGKDPKPVR